MIRWLLRRLRKQMTPGEYRRSRCRSLRAALQGLAAPFETQIQIYPDFVNAPDELATDFSHWYEVVRKNADLDLTAAQRECLDVIADRLAALSGPTGPWSDEALRDGPRWAELRELAKEALSKLQWPIADPPKSPSQFIPAGG